MEMHVFGHGVILWVFLSGSLVSLDSRRANGKAADSQRLRHGICYRAYIKAPGTFGSCQRSVFPLGVSP